NASDLFMVSSISTGAALALIGALKGFVTEQSRIKGIVETVLLGGVAATIAFFVGDVLEKIL
ncbi:MAG TPA: hypothetical protein EYN21_08775, partial [Candidatus Marinimicrobia bacterium]|nr:hypothetical protein [Candidatus Neomarinimicrobiota bacterium]